MRAAIVLLTCTCLATAGALSAGEVAVEHYSEDQAAQLPFSDAVRVGDMLYLSGQIGLKPGTREVVSGGLAAEAKQTMENVTVSLDWFFVDAKRAAVGYTIRGLPDVPDATSLLGTITFSDASGQPVVLQPGYFSQVGGRQVDFYADYYWPFVARYTAAIRSVAPEALIFVEGVPHQGQPDRLKGSTAGMVYAPHWYDGLTLLSKSFKPWLTVDPDRAGATKKVVEAIGMPDLKGKRVLVKPNFNTADAAPAGTHNDTLAQLVLDAVQHVEHHVGGAAHTPRRPGWAARFVHHRRVRAVEAKAEKEVQGKEASKRSQALSTEKGPDACDHPMTEAC